MRHPLKVLLVASDVNQIGGIEQYNRNVAAGIREAGETLRLVELKGISPLEKIGFVLRIARECLFWRPDVIWCAHLAFSPVVFLLAAVLRLRYLVPLYGIEAIRIQGFLQARALEAANLLTPIAHNTASNLLSQLPQVRERIAIIPNSVDGARFTPRPRPAVLVKRHGLEGRRVILTVARLNEAEAKGYDRVIDALPLVLEAVPEATYVLVGGGTDPRVQAAISRYGVAERVVLAGAVPAEELVEYYNLCDVYAMPSRFEGFAIVFLEALSCGKPVVASSGFGCSEALLDGQLGMTVNPESREDIAAAIIRLLTDPPAVLADPKALRERTLSVYDIAVFKKRVASAVRRAAGEP